MHKSKEFPFFLYFFSYSGLPLQQYGSICLSNFADERKFNPCHRRIGSSAVFIAKGSKAEVFLLVCGRFSRQESHSLALWQQLYKMHLEIVLRQKRKRGS
ncbi:MAG TPA: hypothetical protein V6C91_10040 [Coleofasciculaceae cyanobacterium]